MDNQSKPGAGYPNKMGRILLLALEETLGNEEAGVILSQADLPHGMSQLPPDSLEAGFELSEISQIQAAMETRYGPRGGRGLAQRTGRATFKYALREFGEASGFTQTAFRLLPFEEKIQKGIGLFAGLLNRYTDQQARLIEEPAHYQVELQECPVCRHRHTDAAICYLVVGLLEESLYWASSGKYYDIQETACTAAGQPACIFTIDKQPFG